MREIVGDIWDCKGHFIVIPTNLEGVMGRGLARQVADRWPKLAHALGVEGRSSDTSRKYWYSVSEGNQDLCCLSFYTPELTDRPVRSNLEVDGPGGNPPSLSPEVASPLYYRLVMFPVKQTWRDQANTWMIKASLKLLRNLLLSVTSAPCAVPQVGCGYGELHPAEVIPFIKEVLDPFGDRCVLVKPAPSIRTSYPKAFKPGVRSDKSV